MVIGRLRAAFLFDRQIKPPPDSGNAPIWPREIVLPKPDDTPAGFSQRARYKPVACLVPGQLTAPERAVVFWFCGVLGTTMPEASVNEHRQLVHLENEIWFPEHRLITPPAVDAVVSE